ncbi:hypothetical protein FN846DRAFT_895206 [Sphaerosporella brunnea]|uniref:Uncharacterized protein n=1 Tax=Sphaerosporella brunnea TaxID=1250544 RepID=A0A5J5EGX1_9PEZI|nr:hypothetical protein FN846DRAFT_895206 [Sphaerosporella brunnea]
MSTGPYPSQPLSQPGIYFVPFDSTEFAHYQQFRAIRPVVLSSSSFLDPPTEPPQPPSLLGLSPNQLLNQQIMPAQQPTQPDPSPRLTSHPYVSPNDKNWHWTDHRALYRSMGIDPNDRSTVQSLRQEPLQDASSPLSAPPDDAPLQPFQDASSPLSQPPDDASPPLPQPSAGVPCLATAQTPPPVNAAPIAFATSADSSKPRKKRGRPRKKAAFEISTSATGHLVDSGQVAEIAAAETAGAASSTVGNGLRRSGRNKGFAAKVLDNVYQQAETKLINSLEAANEACRWGWQAFHDIKGSAGGGGSGGGGGSSGSGGSGGSWGSGGSGGCGA